MTDSTEIKILITCEEKLYNSLKEIIKTKDITTENIILIVVELMKIVEKYPKMSGDDKKKNVLYVIKKYVVENNLDDSKKELVFSFIDQLLPSIIDTLISVDKKEIIISVQSVFKKCFKCL